MFQVGQKVVCLRNDWMRPAFIPRFFFWRFRKPAKGNIYTISKIVVADGTLCLELWDLAVRFNGTIGAWNASGFRPVIERKTSISVFTALLNPSPQRVRELEEIGR